MAETPDPSPTPYVHALLVCRALSADAKGEISLENVVEVVPVDKVPAEIGPLTFVAFVRNLPPGPTEAAFVLRPPPSPEGEAPLPAQKIPVKVDLPAGLQDRQLALHVTAPAIPVSRGGWYELYFEWNGTPLSANRFAVGVRS